MAGEKHKKERNRNKKETKKNKRKTQIAKENEKEIKKGKKIKFKDKHPKISLTIKIILIFMLIAIVVGTGIVVGAIYGEIGEEFEITVEELAAPASNSIIYDTEGNILAELNGEENRKNITLDEMSPYLANAYIAIEDERFETHKGVDILRTGKAIVTFITNGGSSSFGGSTITQQLVKNITKEDDDEGIAGVTRKIKEWAKAYQIERLLSKNQILELYLNTIFVGGKNYCGVETGSYYYFNKSAKDLSLVECAFMAGINSGPNSYNPYGTKAYGTDENKTNKINNKVKVVLNKMLELGYISQEEHDSAVKEVNEQGVTFNKGEKTTNYSYHTDALINQVIKDLMEEKDLSKAAAQNYLETQGLKIYSTQSLTAQKALEEAMANAKRVNSSDKVDENGNAIKTQAASVIIDNKTGYVVACVGGLGEKTARGLNRATQSLRQPGSTIKPISDVIPGLEERIITAATLYNDNYTVFPIEGSKDVYTPKNYNKFRGIISVRQAIETSQNIPFVKIMRELTPAKSMEYLEKMGITTLNHEKDGLAAMSIGGLTDGISPLEMAAAYATIANDGIYIEPTFYTEVKDSNNNVVLSAKQETRRAFSEATAYIAKDILTEPVEGSEGTAKKCAIKGMDVAAKTGTSSGDKDRWLCGFTNYYTGAVWYGFDDPEFVPSTGISPAVLVWASSMTKIHEGLETSRFKAPSNIVTATICRDSGKLASDTCTNTYTEIFEKGTVPQSCEGHSEYTICSETGLLANEYCTKTTTIHKTYLIEKEKLGLWTTESNNQENEIPNTYCELHTKPEETVKPKEDPEEEPDKDDPTIDTEKPSAGDTNKPEDEEKKDPDTNTDNSNKEDSNKENDGAIGGSGDEIPPIEETENPSGEQTTPKEEN